MLDVVVVGEAADPGLDVTYDDKFEKLKLKELLELDKLSKRCNEVCKLDELKIRQLKEIDDIINKTVEQVDCFNIQDILEVVEKEKKIVIDKHENKSLYDDIVSTGVKMHCAIKDKDDHCCVLQWYVPKCLHFVAMVGEIFLCFWEKGEHFGFSLLFNLKHQIFVNF